MFTQFLRTFIRSLALNKSLSAISIIGLALGFSCCMLIVLFLFDQLGYDSYHHNLNRIYRINTKLVSEGSVDHVAISAAPLPEALIKHYPEVEAAVRFEPKSSGIVVRNDKEVFREYGAYGASADVFKMFTYTFLHGDPKTALLGPDRVVLTSSAAMKYFGTDDVVGRTLEIGAKNKIVTGLIDDVPENSEIRFSLLMSFDNDQIEPDWFDFSYYVFVMFREESLQREDFYSTWQKNLQLLADRNINAAMKEENLDMSVSMHLQPLKDLHFDNSLSYDTPKGNKSYVYIFFTAALLILFVACINYINFSIVQSMQKSREIGIRKVVGSTFFQLVSRFLGQSMLLTLLAVIIALMFVFLLLPLFNNVVGRNFLMNDLFKFEIFIAIVGVIMVTGIFAGSYPALYGSSIDIVNALKGHTSSPGGKAVRMASIAIQFAVSIGLIITTTVIYMQIDYIRNYDVGFRPNNIVAISTPEDSLQFSLVRAFKEELLTHHNLVKHASIVGDGAMPGDVHDEKRGSITLTNQQGKDEVRMINITHVDPEYFSVMKIELKSGRSYDTERESDLQNSIIVNDALVKALGWTDPLSQTVKWGGDRRVIGVVGDIHFKSLYNPVVPQIFVPHNYRIVNVLVSLTPKGYHSMNELKSVWGKYFPNEPFVYRYLDHTLQDQYKQENTVVLIATYFSGLTIIISLLGIFGLSLLDAYQRKKEIGIRKIVGAGFYDIARLFFVQYMPVLIIALLIVSPMAWYLMDQWLTKFIDHIPLDITVFITVGIAFSLVTLLAVTIGIKRVSGINSVDLVRSGM